MSIKKILEDRSNSQCELCGSTDSLNIYMVPPAENVSADNAVYICSTCKEQIEDESKMDAQHWRCLNDSMWKPNLPVQVVSWRMLHRLKDEGWPLDLLEMLYLDEETLKWAKATGDHLDENEKIVHRDSNGAPLKAGDTVTLIKDLQVKGAGFTAKRGTAVRNITLVADNAEHIEGKVNGQHIVILTQYVKKN